MTLSGCAGQVSGCCFLPEYSNLSCLKSRDLEMDLCHRGGSGNGDFPCDFSFNQPNKSTFKQQHTHTERHTHIYIYIYITLHYMTLRYIHIIHTNV